MMDHDESGMITIKECGIIARGCDIICNDGLPQISQQFHDNSGCLCSPGRHARTHTSEFHAPIPTATRRQEFEHGFKVESTRAWFEALGIKAGLHGLLSHPMHYSASPECQMLLESQEMWGKNRP